MPKSPSIAVALLASLLALVAVPARAADDLLAMGLEDLMKIGVVGASKYEQGQKDVAAAVSVITRREIRAHGWRTLGDALSSLPGFSTTYDRQYVYPSMRGLGLPGDYATRVLVTIDGMRINDALYDQGPFGRLLPIDLDLVDRIEFIPGPGGAVYGQNAMFGVVNLVTRSAAQVGGVEVAINTQQPQRLREGRLSYGGEGPLDTELLLSVSGMGADGENRFYDYGASGVSGVARGLDWSRDRELFARVRRGAWSFEGFHGANVKGDPTANYFTDPLAPGKDVEDVYSQGQIGFQDDFVGGSLQFSARAFVGHYEAEATGSAGGWNFATLSHADWFGAEIRFVSTAWQQHTLMWGAEGQVETRRDQAFVDLDTGAGSFELPGTGHRAGVYVQDQWQLTPTIATTLGVRADDSQWTGMKLSPRAGVIWKAADPLTLKALYGRAQRAPNGFERDYDDRMARTSNPDLAGERVDTAELVADLQLPREYALRASVYRWRLQDIVTSGFDPVTGLAQYQSGLPVDANGVELSLDHTWGGGARLRGSVSLQDADWTGIGPLANSPELLGKLNYVQPLPWWGLQFAGAVRYDSARLTLARRRIGGVALADVALRTERLSPGLDVALTITNVLDRRYEQPVADTNWRDAVEQDGRSVQVTLGYRF
ncbi:MAG: TonB-dependent receptor [Steroidobacteraceae bacterium]